MAVSAPQSKMVLNAFTFPTDQGVLLTRLPAATCRPWPFYAMRAGEASGRRALRASRSSVARSAARRYT